MSTVEWMSMVEQMKNPAPKASSKRDESRKRVVLLIKRKKVIAIADVVREIGIPDMTARRVLAEIEPSVARAIPGRPARWRAV